MIFRIFVLDSVFHSWSVPMIKITDLYVLCKWENLQNRQRIKYLFSPLYLLNHVNDDVINILLLTNLSLDDLQNFSYWSHVALCNDDVIRRHFWHHKKKSHFFSMWRTWQVPSFNFFQWSGFGDTEVQCFSFFPTWLPHHKAYDIIFYHSNIPHGSWTDDENFVSIPQGVPEKRKEQNADIIRMQVCTYVCTYGTDSWAMLFALQGWANQKGTLENAHLC